MKRDAVVKKPAAAKKDTKKRTADEELLKATLKILAISNALKIYFVALNGDEFLVRFNEAKQVYVFICFPKGREEGKSVQEFKTPVPVAKVLRTAAIHKCVLVNSQLNSRDTLFVLWKQ